jgi:hypothetical protein
MTEIWTVPPFAVGGVGGHASAIAQTCNSCAYATPHHRLRGTDASTHVAKLNFLDGVVSNAHLLRDTPSAMLYGALVRRPSRR